MNEISAQELEQQIAEIEGFQVMITRGGRNVRNDKHGFCPWDGINRTKRDRTVSDFKKKFEEKYRGYSIEIIEVDGNIAHGNTNLENVREGYSNGN